MPLSSYVAVASLVLSSFSAQSNAVPTSTVSSTASSYVFNPNATDNLVVYYGSTIKTTTTNLTNLCNNIDIDIVVLTFIHEIIGGGGYPDINFGVLCSGQTSEMVTADATGLLWCPDLANAIGDCQSVGKKVLISIGGAKGNVTFASVAMANQSAQMLWDIFGAGTAYDVNYRPFGDIVVDGFDIGGSSTSLVSFLPDKNVIGSSTNHLQQTMKTETATTGQILSLTFAHSLLRRIPRPCTCLLHHKPITHLLQNPWLC